MISIQPMILYDADADADWIDVVLALPKQLAPGDIVYRPAASGQSYTIPAFCFEVVSIELAPHAVMGKCYVVKVRYDYGGREVLTWSTANINHERVVGGDKIVRANTEPGAVVKMWPGWIWKEGR